MRRWSSGPNVRVARQQNPLTLGDLCWHHVRQAASPDAVKTANRAEHMRMLDGRALGLLVAHGGTVEELMPDEVIN